MKYKKFLLCFLAIIFFLNITLTNKNHTKAIENSTFIQKTVHSIAEMAREIGLPEDNPIIQEASKQWFMDMEEIKILAKVVYHEARGSNDRCQQLVAQVVINRINSPKFPNNIKAVINQKNQYNSMYTVNLPDYNNCDDVMKHCFENALLAYKGQVECPTNVLFQSEYYYLGTGIYESIYSEVTHTTTYFNYG